MDKYNNIEKKTILIDNNIINILYKKIEPSLELLSNYLFNNKNLKKSFINYYDLLLEFFLDCKNINIIYFDKEILLENPCLDLISQNIINLENYNIFYNNLYKLPNNIKQFEKVYPYLYKVINDYLRNYLKPLYIYVNDNINNIYIQIKKLLQLKNFYIISVDDSNKNDICFNNLKEALISKKIPTLNASLNDQINLLESILNSSKHKYDIFINNEEIKEKNKIRNKEKEKNEVNISNNNINESSLFNNEEYNNIETIEDKVLEFIIFFVKLMKGI